MKKLLLILCVLALIALPFLQRRGTSSHIHVMSNGGDIPNHAPFEGYPLLESFLENKGCQVEWFDVRDLPKRHQYGKRLYNFFLKPQKGLFIFNNYFEYFSKAKIAQLPKGKRILITWEPPSVLIEMYQDKVFDVFDRVYTWRDDLVDGKKFIKFCYPELRPMRDNLPAFHKRKLLCMINSNLKFNHYEKQLYPLRKEMAKFFEDKPEGFFDLYGRNWEGFRNAKGKVPDKYEALKNYKFSICFENTKDPGYITEKIFDCFVVGTIPIYLGAPNIESYIPKECFIDYRQFKSNEEMLSYIQNLTEEEYQKYLSHMRAFIDSEEAKQFSREAFSKLMIDAVNL